LLLDQARALFVPLSIVDLSSEKLAKDLYEKRLILIRPDEHVAWRGDQISDAVQAEGILNVVTGRGRSELNSLPLGAEAPKDAFSATIGLTTQVGSFDLEKMGAFQQ
jgi:FAD-dependent monooxygenase